jgi:protein gp37
MDWGIIAPVPAEPQPTPEKMMAETTIQWTATPLPDGTLAQGFTFNPWIGCSRVSPACDACYADRGSRRLAAQHGLKLWDDGSTRFFTGEDYWKKPASWNRKAERLGVHLKVFCASYADVFEDRPELVKRRERLFHMIEGTPWLDWLLLTKRPENMTRMALRSWATGWPRNVWAGTTIEGEAQRKARVGELSLVPAAVRFVSCEPLIDLPYFARNLMICEHWKTEDALPRAPWCPPWPKFWWQPQALVGAGYRRPFDWMIIGGESGTQARLFDPEWARNLVAQCRAAGVAPFVKQMGRRIAGPHDGFLVNRWVLEDGTEYVPPIIGENANRRPTNAKGFVLFDEHGGDWNEWPSDLRVREYPEARP